MTLINARTSTKPPFKKLGLVGKHAQALNADNRRALSNVAQWLSQHCDHCWVETATAQAIEYTGMTCKMLDLPEKVDAVVVMGGDGTMLSAARELATYHIPLIGLNQGHLGFMTDIALASFAKDLSAVLSGEYSLEHRSMIAGSHWRGNQCIATALALNDAVISRGASSSMIDVSVSVDGRHAYRLRADGLVVATPTGSTAYALSANGPIMHPSMTGFIMVPIAPQTLSNRPIVLPDSCVIDVLIEASRNESTLASFDMQQWQSLHAGDTIRIEKSPHTTLLVHTHHYDYYNTLRQKLHWTFNPVNPQA